MRDLKIFNVAVEKFFEPIAREIALPISAVQDGVYEIASAYFVLRIRLHTGHRRGLNVLLRPASIKEFDESQPDVEYGIGNFSLFEGKEWKEQLIETDADFLRQAEAFAAASKCFGVPYLLGKGENFDAIKEMVRRRAGEETEKIQGYRFPKNVRKEWI